MIGIYTVSITGICNRSCSYCVANCPQNKELTTGELNAPMYSNVDWIVNEASDFGGYIALTGGEPLIHPGINTLVRNITNIGKKVIIYTNGDYIHNHIDLLRNKSVFWLLSTHTKYRSSDVFIKTRDMFPIERTLINHLAFNDEEFKLVSVYVGPYEYFISGNSKDISSRKYDRSSWEITNDIKLEMIEKSKMVTPDGFKWLGVCDKAFDAFVAPKETMEAATIHKLKNDPYILCKAEFTMNMIKNICGMDCNAVRVNTILSKFISERI